MYGSRYLENQVLSADGVGLVCLLYQGAIDAVRQAREHLEQGRIQERSDAITRAMQIVAELQVSLDLEKGGEVAQALAQLYAYIQERLVEANARQQGPPLDEALTLLSIVHEGWKDIAAEPAAAAATSETIEAGSLACTL